jgi:putative hemolysin
VELMILLVLILLNGAFALSEMAVVSSRKARLQQLADDRRAGASAALALANEPSSFLSTIQVGITLIGITSGAFGEAALSGDLSAWLSRWPALDPYSGTLAVVLIVAGITFASLIVGELVPKRLALLNPEALASFVAKPMQILSRLAYPAVWLLSLVTDGVLKVLGLSGFAQPPVSEEEIKVLMEQGAEAGIFDEHEEKLVSRVFRLDQIKVGGIMTPRMDIVCLDLDESREENARRIVAHGHSRFPVVKGSLERIEGIVLARDLLADALAGKPLDPAAQIGPALFVPTRMSVMELMDLFREHRQTIAIAINEHGAVAGLVTLNDVMEALVGDIATADEQAEPELLMRDDGSWLVDGSVTIERLRSALELDETLPGEEEGSYHTVGGFVMEQLGRVPAAGDRFESTGWRWEVVDMDERRVDKVLASPVPEKDSGPER